MVANQVRVRSKGVNVESADPGRKAGRQSGQTRLDLSPLPRGPLGGLIADVGGDQAVEVAVNARGIIEKPVVCIENLFDGCNEVGVLRGGGASAHSPTIE